jgi:hypothetical protein
MWTQTKMFLHQDACPVCGVPFVVPAARFQRSVPIPGTDLFVRTATCSEQCARKAAEILGGLHRATRKTQQWS